MRGFFLPSLQSANPLLTGSGGWLASRCSDPVTSVPFAQTEFPMLCLPPSHVELTHYVEQIWFLPQTEAMLRRLIGRLYAAGQGYALLGRH